MQVYVSNREIEQIAEGYISETDYHAIVSLAEDDLKATLYLG